MADERGAAVSAGGVRVEAKNPEVPGEILRRRSFSP